MTPVRHTGTPAICPLVGTPRSLGQPLEGTEGEGDEEGDSLDEPIRHLDADFSGEHEEDERLPSSGEGLSDASSQEEEEEENAEAGQRPERDAGESNGVETPSFVYQRRKFLLLTGDGEESNEVEETFGLVELPVGWPLGR